MFVHVLGVPSSILSHMHHSDCTVLHNKSCSYVTECNLCISESKHWWHWHDWQLSFLNIFVNPTATAESGCVAQMTYLGRVEVISNMYWLGSLPTCYNYESTVKSNRIISYWWINTAKVRSTISRVPTSSLMLYLFFTLPERSLSSYSCDNDERIRVTSSNMSPLVYLTSVKMELQACTFITRKLTLHGVCRKRLIKGVILWSTDNMGP